eukprot:CAMPEP_0198354316 /NCGR_PEP_ID=MMETSP1450-20131203/114862_1 /TAXON_ID=753684 ORGANISM="Madagascaria erythrocladiodes, Strain CCMP3234" /NCGR_SAMPLE_ID=MMETSP1450 /ASSEMBLY_ACC=CAM_ASM_001115 /LENGTH=49 /DNA_ID=CAMNT_0044060561 /DNA_START=892 /DNA_END=1041 /DNA_ORIENTATION=-
MARKAEEHFQFEKETARTTREFPSFEVAAKTYEGQINVGKGRAVVAQQE